MTRSTAASANRPRFSSRLISGVAAAGAGVVLLSVSAFGGTYAHWADTEQLNLGTITAGSLDLTAGGQDQLELGTLATGMLPGDRVTAPVTLATAGDVETNVTVALTTTGAGGHEVRIARGNCDSATFSGSALTSVPVTFDRLAADDTVETCIEVRLPMNAPSSAAGESSSLTVAVTATQVID